MAWRVMGRMALDTDQAAHLLEHCADHPGVKPAFAVGVGISKSIDFILYFHDNARNSA